MKKILAIFILMQSSALAQSYPPEAERISESLSRLNSVKRCNPSTRHEVDRIMETHKSFAKSAGYDWDRIQRNAQSTNYNCR